MAQILNRIYHRLRREIYVPIDIMRKHQDYRRDANYKNNNDINRCFLDRFDPTSDDTALLKRIASAYKKASLDLLDHPAKFRPSNEWLPIYRNSYKEVVKSLENCDTNDLNRIYRNFWRESCSVGLVGLPLDMKRTYFSNGKIGFLDKALYLNDCIHRFNLWTKLLGQRFSIDNLISPLVGNPYGYFINSTFIKAGADYQHYYATRINDLLIDKRGNKVVAEIGGGFGGMAYYLLCDATNTSYIDFDLPENLALATYYLLKCFPEKNALLYGEADLENVNLAAYDVVLMPNFEIDKLPENSCDIIFNSYSLAEMSKETIDHYISKSAKLINSNGWFFHVNHTKHSLVSGKDFPIPENFSLVAEEFAAWNLGRNSNMDEYEFLYQKCK